MRLDYKAKIGVCPDSCHTNALSIAAVYEIYFKSYRS
jgi:hypothetical protein